MMNRSARLFVVVVRILHVCDELGHFRQLLFTATIELGLYWDC